MISQKSVQEILETAKVEEVIEDFVNLKRRGANMLGLCPFHNEKTPSFTVSPSKNLYKCFGYFLCSVVKTSRTAHPKKYFGLFSLSRHFCHCWYIHRVLVRLQYNCKVCSNCRLKVFLRVELLLFQDSSFQFKRSC